MSNAESADIQTTSNCPEVVRLGGASDMLFRITACFMLFEGWENENTFTDLFEKHEEF